MYTDYRVSRGRFLSELTDARRGFRGYRVMARRDLAMSELIPNGWTPMLPKPGDGDSHAWREHLARPFGVWTVMERFANFSVEHGPERFCPLYMCSEGTAAYQALYNSNRVKPKVLFLIQHGFGGNWTNFENPQLILARSVRSNPAGMPDYLVGRYAARDQGSIQGDSYWPMDYPRPTLVYQYGGYGFGVWQCKVKNNKEQETWP